MCAAGLLLVADVLKLFLCCTQGAACIAGCRGHFVFDHITH
jgi:hypothetical protein